MSWNSLLIGRRTTQADSSASAALQKLQRVWSNKYKSRYRCCWSWRNHSFMFSHRHDKDGWSLLQSLLTIVMGYLGFTWKAPTINIFMESASDVFSTYGGLSAVDCCRLHCWRIRLHSWRILTWFMVRIFYHVGRQLKNAVVAYRFVRVGENRTAFQLRFVSMLTITTTRARH